MGDCLNVSSLSKKETPTVKTMHIETSSFFNRLINAPIAAERGFS